MLAVRRKRVKMNALARKLTNEISRIKATRLQSPNRAAARAFALAASSSRFFGGDAVSRERSRRAEASATSSMACTNAASFVFEGFVNPLIFLTNCSDAARISSSETGGSKLKSVLIFLHISVANLLPLALECNSQLPQNRSQIKRSRRRLPLTSQFKSQNPGMNE